MQRSILVGLILLSTLAVRPEPVVLAQQPPPPLFEAEVEVVNLNVSVVNVHGQFVTDLEAADFTVFEDGIRQKLTLFGDEDLPITLVLMIDGSASMLDKVKNARQAAGQFVKTLQPQDVAQVVQFNDRTQILQDFTSDHRQLTEALQRTDASGPTSLHNALYVSLKDLEREKKKTRELRRRAIVILSDGEDTNSIASDEQVIELAKKTEISIYPIMLRARERDSTRPAFSQATFLLTTLAQESGGSSYEPNSLSELDAVYGRIAEELRTLYSVGYTSSNARRDGRWRRIVVRVPGREDITVRHKIGYYAAR
jgi:Ca-activated chloride channel family protein